jgi:hypothetical protein
MDFVPAAVGGGLLMNGWLQGYAYRISLGWWVFALAVDGPGCRHYAAYGVAGIVAGGPPAPGPQPAHRIRPVLPEKPFGFWKPKGLNCGGTVDT